VGKVDLERPDHAAWSSSPRQEDKAKNTKSKIRKLKRNISKTKKPFMMSAGGCMDGVELSRMERCYTCHVGRRICGTEDFDRAAKYA
jgi:hypothetical protein